MGEYFNKQVFKAVWPICFGYIPLGVACGILGEKVGMDAFVMAMMSIFVMLMVRRLSILLMPEQYMKFLLFFAL